MGQFMAYFYRMKRIASTREGVRIHSEKSLGNCTEDDSSGRNSERRHGECNYHLTQLLMRYDGYRKYLHRLGLVDFGLNALLHPKAQSILCQCSRFMNERMTLNDVLNVTEVGKKLNLGKRNNSHYIKEAPGAELSGDRSGEVEVVLATENSIHYCSLVRRYFSRPSPPYIIYVYIQQKKSLQNFSPRYQTEGRSTPE